MPLDRPRVQFNCLRYGREVPSKVLYWSAGAVFAVSGILAAQATIPEEPRGVNRSGASAVMARPLVPAKPVAFSDQLPDLVAEFSVLSGGDPLAALRLSPEFAPAAPFLFRGSFGSRDHALDCLAAAAWYEAGDNPAGQRSVLQVVLNRVSHPSFPKSVCGVVFQGSERTTGCQFTFTCDGSLRQRVPSRTAWASARSRAMAALDGAVDPTVLQATHYHADYVIPWWSSKLERLAQVGSHIFYRWPGKRGALLGAPGLAPEVPTVSLTALVQHKAGIDALPELPPAPPQITPDMQALTPNTQALTPKPTAVLAYASTLKFSHGTFLQVLPKSPSGRWALDALASCQGRSACQVVGYANEAQLDRNRSLAGPARERPAFLFVRDPVSKMDLVLWDCEQVIRHNSDECLPADGPALNQLMHERSE